MSLVLRILCSQMLWRRVLRQEGDEPAYSAVILKNGIYIEQFML